LINIDDEAAAISTVTPAVALLQNILAFLKPKASSEALKRGAESALSALQQGIEVPELDASSAAALAKALAEVWKSLR
jgi:hypothetical protein